MHAAELFGQFSREIIGQELATLMTAIERKIKSRGHERACLMRAGPL
jgi:hypothetical protein